MYVCRYRYAYICTYIHTYIFVFIYIYMFTYTCVYLFSEVTCETRPDFRNPELTESLRQSITCEESGIYIYINIYFSICIYICICIHIYKYCIYIYIYVRNCSWGPSLPCYIQSMLRRYVFVVI
jgi:hypothetical protein